MVRRNIFQTVAFIHVRDKWNLSWRWYCERACARTKRSPYVHGGDDYATDRRTANRFIRGGGPRSLNGQAVDGEVGKVTQVKGDPNGFQLFQVAFNTCDLAGTLGLYADVFGFANGGAQLGWGDVRKIQDLDTDGQNVAWWLVAAQPRMQLEVFSLSGPPSRPGPSDWCLQADFGMGPHGNSRRRL